MTEKKYRVFISYSHVDEEWGDWLQRALETYAAPRALVGGDSPHGPVPRRLTPVFRDRDDLPASGSLNAEIQAALAASHFQVVLCSPGAAQSKWVNEEIKLFKKLHGPDRTLAVIVAGEPGASNIPGREDMECFPPALRFRVDENGEVTDEPAEPIAADARKGKDGRRGAITKLAAGLLGVSLDDLIQREAARRAQRAWYVSGASLAMAGVLALLSIAAVRAGNEARFMRGEAENLIEFMLTDLRDKLEPVGRLDVLESVGERAMEYYDEQKLSALDGEALNRRAKALLLLGNIEEERYDLEAALEAYKAAEATTAEQLRRAPNNPDRIFDHAQSVFYVGSVSLTRDDVETAERQNQEYLRLAERLASLEPGAPRSLLELAYANSNLGSVRVQSGDHDGALAYFERSYAARRDLYRNNPDDAKLTYAFAYSMSWLAYTEMQRSNYTRAIDVLMEQLDLSAQLLDEEVPDYRLLGDMFVAHRRLAESYYMLGDVDRARREVKAGRALADRLLLREANNTLWRLNTSYLLNLDAALAALEGDQARAASLAQQSFEALDRNVADEDVQSWNNIGIGIALSRQLEFATDDIARAYAAQALTRHLDRIIVNPGANAYTLIANASLLLSRRAEEAGDSAAADALRDRAIAILENDETALTVPTRIGLAGLYRDAGAAKKAAALIAALDAQGVAAPDFIEEKTALAAASANTVK